jgi:trigger factor
LFILASAAGCEQALWKNTWPDDGRRFVEETYQNQRTNKMLQWIETQVKPVDQNITAEEFNKLNEEHQHHHHE